MINGIAVIVFIIGQIFIGRVGVHAPDSEVHIAITTSIPADVLYATAETWFCEPPKIVTSSVTKPIKYNLTPSAAHSTVMI